MTYDPTPAIQNWMVPTSGRRRRINFKRKLKTKEVEASIPSNVVIIDNETTSDNYCQGLESSDDDDDEDDDDDDDKDDENEMEETELFKNLKHYLNDE
ncbi:hypothetical protein SNE40_017826 [Patella caerulea]|uniref:Uncharacterized protein n=1 Tax=Patella caerulea TaxID=87958 RepID=A0AAN8JBU3_PATCE